jgi:glucose-6-phosphate isomerase
VLTLQDKLLALLGKKSGVAFTVEAAADAIGAADEIETVYKVLEHAAANPDHSVVRTPGQGPFDARYGRQ